MSFIKKPLIESEASITRPIILAVVRQIMQRTGIPEDTHINFKGEAESVWQVGSEIGHSNPNTNPKLAGDSQLYIEAVESPVIEQIAEQDNVRDNGHPSLFNDDKLGIVVNPIKKYMAVVLTFRLRSNSKTFAQRWKDNIWANVANQRDLDWHTASYSYPFPPEFTKILKYFHTLRENVAGYGDTFEDYFNTHRDNNLTTVSNQSGSTALWYKPETQTRMLGWFDFQGEPEKANKEGESSTWTTEFSYIFRYEKTTHAVMRFPVMVHNQLVDKRLFGKMQSLLGEKQLQYSKVTATNRFFESDQLLSMYMKRKPQPKYIPFHDDIVYDQYVLHTFTLFSCIIDLDPSTNILFNLKDLGHYGIDDDVMAYLQDIGYKHITKPYDSMLNLSLYRNEYLTDPLNLTILPNMDVVANNGTDIRKINRVRLSYYNNVIHSTIDGLKTFQNHPEALRKLVAIGDTKPNDIYRLRPRIDLTWLLPHLPILPNKPDEIFHAMNQTMDFSTVLLSHIRAHRMES